MAKVMLVEDDNNLREIYEARLQAEGYQVVAAKDGEEALVVAKAEKPDLVISDVMMPKISGFEMLDILRNTPGLEGIKVIMLTALGQTDDQQRADRLGADRYLVKSQVTLEDIVKVAHELLGDGGGAAAPAAAAVAATPAASTDTPAEPAAATPAPEPVQAPPAADEPAAAPTADPAPAQTTAQEEAAVEAKIEDFVAGATEAPAAEAAPEPEAPAHPQIKLDGGAKVPDPADAEADDKLMAAALDNLAASASPAGETADTPPVTPEPAPASTPETPQEPEAAPAPELANNQIIGQKNITPLDSKEKPNLEALLAKEAASESGGSASAADPVIVTNDAGVVPPADVVTPAAGPASDDKGDSKIPAPGDKIDPNSIAL